MASHFVSMKRGATADRGDLYNLTTGTSTTAGDTIELRLDDAGAYTVEDVVLALKKFQQFFENIQLASTAGFAVNP